MNEVIVEYRYKVKDKYMNDYMQEGLIMFHTALICFRQTDVQTNHNCRKASFFRIEESLSV